MRVRVRRFWRQLGLGCVAFYRNGGIGRAKGAAYSAFLAFFPVLTTTAAVLFQANAAAVARNFSGLLYEVVPPGTEELVLNNLIVQGERPLALLVTAGLLSLWAGSGLMMSLIEGFQLAYGGPNMRGLVRQRLVAMGLVVASGLPVILASALLVFGDRAERTVLQSLGVLPRGEELRGGIVLLGQALRFALALGSIVLGTSFLYHFGPQKPHPFRRVLPGALVTTVVWGFATMGFAWYVRNVAHYNVMYGSVGTVIALLVWMFLLSMIALVGCEYNAVRDRVHPAPARREPAAAPTLPLAPSSAP